MKRIAVFLAVTTMVAPTDVVLANASVGFERAGSAQSGGELPPYLQCVPYARQLTGIQLYGDAYTWWDQAEGKYDRGRRPRVGAVMAFAPHRTMQLGHVAAVSKVIDSRTVLLDHANWSPINGRRGQIERDVKAVDVSPNNDWSEVRVWYAPLGGLGTTVWPVHGFIYGKPTKLDRSLIAAAPNRQPQAAPAGVPAQVRAPVRAEPSRQFASAFAGFEVMPSARSAPTRGAAREALPQAKPTIQRKAAIQPRSASIDPIDAALARYGR